MKRRLSLSVLLILVVAVCAVTAYAHHSVAALYDASKMIRIEGKLISFSFRSPHSVVIVEATDAKGTMQRWAIEWAGTSQLSNSGITQDTLKIGDEITVVGRPSRVPGEFKALMVNLKRPSDGFSWGSRAGDVVD